MKVIHTVKLIGEIIHFHKVKDLEKKGWQLIDFQDITDMSCSDVSVYHFLFEGENMNNKDFDFLKNKANHLPKMQVNFYGRPEGIKDLQVRYKLFCADEVFKSKQYGHNG